MKAGAEFVNNFPFPLAGCDLRRRDWIAFSRQLFASFHGIRSFVDLPYSHHPPKR
jgi:hypothetical protein